MSDPEYLVGPDDVESQVFDWGVLKWLSTPAVTGGERFSAGIVKLEPGRGHERHTHPDSDEILYVVRGEGEQEVADETFDVEAGDLVFVPEGVEHGTVNTDWEPLLLLAVYAPPGPEEVLGDLPECEIVPPGEIPTTDRGRSDGGNDPAASEGDE
ncbi:putative cupin [Salinarchaeum sp. Harcht-Bsk1]|uniref:cupin domain-containing protein n=1 Tax=Salinarchaeum sp. Harcht-Bsk1 TaxID=1333523 RepID=UPI000342398F|nr:cupin domain-containing protein [Salinarchaeum sp. Harcht-Bsk1]AGN02285.1 putative cupin [Salinarchaeum sp. Harcht-Bsk1]